MMSTCMSEIETIWNLVCQLIFASASETYTLLNVKIVFYITLCWLLKLLQNRFSVLFIAYVLITLGG